MAEYMTARTDYTFEELVDLKRVAGRTMDRARVTLHRGVILLLAAACPVLGVLVLAGPRPDYAVAGVYFLLGAVMLVASWKYYRLVAARMERKTRKKRSPDHFVFGEYGVDITRGEEKARCPYSDCARLLETGLCFYLFHQGGKGLTISKANIQGGSPDELRAWLEGKCQLQAQWMGGRN